MIPEDEVWVKIGGDKGGGTMKLNFRICNVNPLRTRVYAMFEVPDSATNVHVVLERHNDQVSQLASAQWWYIHVCMYMYMHLYNICTCVHKVALLKYIDGKDSASSPAVTISFCAFSTEFLVLVVLLVRTCICTTKSEMNMHISTHMYKKALLLVV